MRPELRFRPIANLGAGAHARVQLAYDRLRRMQVAIKRLHQPDADGLFRLKQEFRAARDLSHPNLVQVYDLIESGGECLFTMEPVFGVDLGRYARERLAAGGLPVAPCGPSARRCCSCCRRCRRCTTRAWSTGTSSRRTCWSGLRAGWCCWTSGWRRRCPRSCGPATGASW